ncbi:hypothetical protein ENUP19_0248G0106 [Entamoeba nuttalli]|uniref:RhoGAP domain containing protein n=2 Tax=Entamoeba nuttalli TaxID=412467 RepID=K2G5H4_ENTNP|nr:RhoGAP domain containing protein [Entamoeba nuttalli P19]EKE37576.1 RhoGAP domain containing protein [Entamoeba nuttalli P19]|eukprot:XP_008860102.1 RhoGAP domain containing protein [Entamoeba nuttalli P19]
MPSQKKIEKRPKDVLREVKRMSMNRERISNAGIIGMYVLLGNEVIVKTPSKISYQTLPHLKIEDTVVYGQNVRQYLKNQYGFENITDSRTKEIIVMNAVSSTFMELLGGKQTRKKGTSKNVKLMIFESIKPFNKIGFQHFAESVINIVSSIINDNKCKRQQTVHLQAYDERIIETFKVISSNQDNLDENGLEIVNMILKQVETIYQSDVVEDQFFNPIIQQPMDIFNYEIVNEIAFWYYQQLFEEKCYEYIEGLAECIKGHAEYIDSIYCINLPGLSKSVGLNHINESLQCISNELETISERFRFCHHECHSLIERLNTLILSQSKQDASKIRGELQCHGPLHLHSIIQSFQRMFSECDLQISANRDMLKAVANAQQQKLLNDIRELSGNESNRYLKKDLKEILKEEQKTKDQLPNQIESIFLYIINSCCEKEFIMNKANNQEKDYAKEVLLRMDQIEFEGLPPNVVCECLKMFLKQLPNSLINSELTNTIIQQWNNLGQPNEYSTHNKPVRQMINSCNKESITLLTALLKVCCKIESLSDVNKMNEQSLADNLYSCIFSINSLSTKPIKSKQVQIEQLKKESTLKEIIVFLIKEFQHLFPENVSDITTMRSQMKQMKIDNCFGTIQRVVEKADVKKRGTTISIPHKNEPKTLLVKPKPLLTEIQEFLRKKGIGKQ